MHACHRTSLLRDCSHDCEAAPQCAAAWCRQVVQLYPPESRPAPSQQNIKARHSTDARQLAVLCAAQKRPRVCAAQPLTARLSTAPMHRGVPASDTAVVAASRLKHDAA